MRIVATSDTHYPFSTDAFPSGDVLIHAGDFMYSGYPEEWYPRLASLAALDYPTKIMVPGNHDYHIQNYTGVAKAELRKQAKTKLVMPDNPIVKLPNGMHMLGVPFVTGLPGWAFNVEEEWLTHYLNGATYGFQIDVVVSHAPVYGILDAIRPLESEHRAQEHVGSLALNKWFYGLDRKPLVWINGHIHESYGTAVVEGCHFYNVAMCDRSYEQSNDPMVIEL